MTILANYRSSQEYREILRLLQKSTTLEDNLLWQSHALGKTLIPLQYLEIDFIAREVIASFNSQHHHLDTQLPLYVKLGYRMSVFKVPVYRHGVDTVTFPFPDLIKTQELRTHPRHTFKPAQEKFVMLKSSTPHGQLESGSELKVRAMDISPQGLGLIVSEQNRNFLKNNRILWITGLQDSIFDKPLLAEVVYINSEVDPKFVTRKQKLLKVGLKVSDFFPQETYDRFLT